MSPTLDTYTKKAGESVIIYGPPKTGKTLLAGLLAELYKVHWFDLENGVQTLITQLPVEWKKNITIYPIPDTKSSPIAAQTLFKVFQGGPVKICIEHGRAFCVDCTKAGLEQQEICLNQLTRKDVVVVDTLSQWSDSGWAYTTFNGGDITWKEYEKWNQIMASGLSYIQQARCNIVVIGHPIEVEMDDSTKKLVPQCATKNFSSRVCKFFGHVVYTDLKMKEFKVSSNHEGNPSALSGSRSNMVLDLKKGITLKYLLDPSLKLPSIVQK